MPEVATPLDSPQPDRFDAEPPLSAMQRITNTFIAPTRTFADLRRNRSWWLPLLLSALFSYLFTVTAMTRVGPTRLAESAIRSSPSQNDRLQQASPEQRAQTIRITAAAMQISFYGWPLLLMLFSAIGALLLWVGFNFILGGSATYAGMFAVAVFAWLPSIVRAVLCTAVLYAGDADSFNINDPVGTNPGFYMDAGSPVFLKTLLGSVDMITLWILLLMVLGGAIVARVRISSGVTLVFVCWLLYALIRAGAVAATS